ncbi:TPA: hypothetical protein ACHJCJ_004792 [Klebsiella pneumoniae]
MTTPQQLRNTRGKRPKLHCARRSKKTHCRKTAFQKR